MLDQSVKAAAARLLHIVAFRERLGEASLEELREIVAVADAQFAERGGDLARSAIKRILRPYPAPDVDDPRALLEDMVESIEDYPAFVLEALQSPKAGILRECKFRPNIAEIVSWCDQCLRQGTELVEQAREALDWKEHEGTMRALEAAAEAQCRAAQLREAETARFQGEVKEALVRMRLPNRPRRPGESSARERWETAMAKALGERPDLIPGYLRLLSEDPDLCHFATQQENTYSGTGWPELSKALSGRYTSSRGERS